MGCIVAKLKASFEEALSPQRPKEVKTVFPGVEHSAKNIINSIPTTFFIITRLPDLPRHPSVCNVLPGACIDRLMVQVAGNAHWHNVHREPRGLAILR